MFAYIGQWYIKEVWVEQIIYYNVDPASIDLTTDWRFKAVPEKRTQLKPYGN